MRGSVRFYAFLGLIVTYLGLTFLLPPDPAVLERYHLTSQTLRLLNVSIAAPLVAIWLAAYYGYARLHCYGSTIRSSAEGRPVDVIATGLMVLVFGLPVSSLVNSLLKFVGRHDSSLTATATIVTNYVALLFPLVAFMLIGAGVRRLTELKRQRPSRLAGHAMIIIFSMIAVGYTYFVLHFAFSDAAGVAAAYAMPLWLVLLTLVVPYLYVWFIGLVAAFEMYLYNSSVKGVLYRRSWSVLSLGIGSIIVTLIIIQYLTTLSAHLARLSLSAVLLLLYGLLMLMAVGYILVAYGAKQLQKIEEV